MIHPPLLLISLFVVGGWAQKPASPPAARPPTSAQGTALENAGFDAKFVAADKLPTDPAQREAFLRANKGEYDRLVAWRQDPDLMFAAERKEPGSAQKALARMEAFAKPEEIGLLRTRLLLAPRGLSAAVPEGAGFEGRPQAASPGTAVSGRSADARTAPASAAPAPAPTPGLRTSPPPGPPAAPPAEAQPGGGWSLDEIMNWACTWVGCR